MMDNGSVSVSTFSGHLVVSIIAGKVTKTED